MRDGRRDPIPQPRCYDCARVLSREQCVAGLCRQCQHVREITPGKGPRPLVQEWRTKHTTDRSLWLVYSWHTGQVVLAVYGSTPRESRDGRWIELPTTTIGAGDWRRLKRLCAERGLLERR